MDLDSHSDRLQVTPHHDGMECRSSGPKIEGVDFLLLLPAVAAAGVGVGGYFLGGSFELSITALALSLVFAIPAVMRRTSGSRVRVTPRWITVSTHGFFGKNERKYDIADLQKVFVATPREDYSGRYLVFDDGDSPFTCFEGLPPGDLEFIRAMIAEARAARERRQQVEGKDYRFEQVAPETITDLVER